MIVDSEASILRAMARLRKALEKRMRIDDRAEELAARAPRTPRDSALADYDVRGLWRRLRPMLDFDGRGYRALADEMGVTPSDLSRISAGQQLSYPKGRLIIRAFMGFGSNAHSDMGRGHKTTGFRANSSRSGTTPAHDWSSYPQALEAVIARMRGVAVERRPAVQVMQSHDWPDTLHYVDPPYVHATRNRRNPYDPKHQYRHEMADGDHVALLAVLKNLVGMVVLSGYPHPLYDQALDGWMRVERESLADGARPRTEVLWINPACVAALGDRAAGHGTPLFGVVA